MRKLALVSVVALAAALAAAVPASASTPERGHYDDLTTFVDPDVCAPAPWGFDVSVIQHEYGFYEVFLNADGSFAKAIVHRNYDAWISANGNTIVERDTWTDTYYPGGATSAGLTVHILGPGGIVVRDAGRIVFDQDGNVVSVQGPHEQLSGVSFCPALAG